MAENQIEKLMRLLDISEDEAKQIIADDKAIDQGKKMDFDLTKEQEKATRKYRQADKKPFVPNLTKRERRPNELKREIIDDLFSFIVENWPEAAKNGDIVNKERQIDFSLNGENFSLTLTQHRKPKDSA